jgi:hypothetical protein
LSLPAEYTWLTVGFAAIFDSSSDNTREWLKFLYGGNQQWCCRFTSGRAFEIRDVYNGNILATSDDYAITWDSWHYIEFQFTCTGSDTMIIRVDGNVVMSASGLNLQYYGSNGVNAIWFGQPATGALSWYAIYDDLYLLDNTGTTFKDFLGDVAIDGHLFEADGTDQDWTPNTGPDHYDNINVNTSSYATDFIEGDTEAYKDSFTVTPTEYASGILGVEVSAFCYNDTGGEAYIRPYCIISSVRYYGDDSQVSNGSTNKRSYIWERNPATSGFWTNSQVAATEFGFEVYSLVAP